jgi:hypothetical protein
MDGVKMSIFPPMKVFLGDIIPSSFVNEAGAKWFMKSREGMNSIQEHNRSPQGINTFQSTYSFLKGTLLSMAGTTDTSISSSVDPGMGKTPQALKMQAAMDQSRSNFDRIQLEKSMERIFGKFVDLIAKKQEKPIKLHLMQKDLELIQKYNPDVVEMFESGKYGEVVVKSDDIKNTKYKYFIDSGTTTKKDDAIENETLTSIIQLMLKLPGAAEQMMQTGKIKLGKKSLDMSEALCRWIITSGVQDWEKIITDVLPEDQEMMGQDPMMQGMEGMMPQGMPQQGVSPQGMPPQMGQEQPMMPQGMPQEGMEQEGEMSPEAQQIISELMNQQ